MATIPDVTNTDRVVDYSPVVPTTAFVIPWVVVADSELLAEDDLVVIVNGATYSSANFTFSGNPITGVSGVWNGGTVTLGGAVSGVRVIIYSKRDPRRTGNYLEGKVLPFTTLDKLMDDIIIQLRDLSLSVKRSFKTSLLNYLTGGSTEMTFSSGTLEAVVAAFLAGISPGTAIAGWTRTLAAAKALYPAPVVLANGHTMSVACRSTTADGYGGIFSYDSADVASTFTSDALGFVDNQSRRWKRVYNGFMNAKWFGAVGDGVTDDYVAFQAAFTTAVASSQRMVYGPTGTYMLSQTVNCSNVGFQGDGAIATTLKASQPFTGTTLLLVDDTTGGGGGVSSHYRDFRIYGNRAALSTPVIGLTLTGNALYLNFTNIRLTECKGSAILIDGKAGPTRPTLNTWSNISINSCDSHGLQMKAGRHMDFFGLAVENVGGHAIWISSATEACSKIGIHRPYLEHITGDGIRIEDADEVHVYSPLVNGYGSTGVASYGWIVSGTGGSARCKLLGGQFATNASPHANSRHIRIDSGYSYGLEEMVYPSSQIQIVGQRGVVINRSYDATAFSAAPVHFTNGRAALAAGQTRFLAANTGGQDATQSNVRGFATGYMTLIGLRAEVTVLPGVGEQYTETLFVNGIATALTTGLTNGNGGVGVSAAEILLAPGDTYSLQHISTGAAASIPQDGLHVTVGLKM